MKNIQTKRMTPQEMRKMLLKNANVLMSSQFKTSAPEVSGQKKKNVKSVMA